MHATRWEMFHADTVTTTVVERCDDGGDTFAALSISGKCVTFSNLTEFDAWARHVRLVIAEAVAKPEVEQ